MAMADYRLCDVCGGKAFFDSNLSYQWEGEEDYSGEKIQNSDCCRIAGDQPPQHCGYKLGYVGDWAVICDTCAQTHKTQIVPIETKEA
jgi:hypothetical protein